MAKQIQSIPLDCFIFDTVEQKMVKKWRVKPMTINNPRISNDGKDELFDPKHPAIKQRISHNKCVHNEFGSCHKCVELVIHFMINIDAYVNTDKYSQEYIEQMQWIILCQQCISEFLINPKFINQFNTYLKQMMIYAQKSIDEFSKRGHGFGVFIGILSSLLICPKIAKLIFKKFWKLLCKMCYFLLKLIHENGIKLFGPINERKYELRSGKMKYNLNFNNLLVTAYALCSHLHRVDLYFTTKHWKFFVKYNLFELMCNATYFEYVSSSIQNLKGERINYAGKSLSSCIYMEWFYTAYGCSVKYSKILQNNHFNAVRKLIQHPRIISFVPTSDVLHTLLETEKNKSMNRRGQYAMYNISKEYWKEYKESKECHCTKCNKIQFYEKNISFKQCKNCCLVVYCSKKCQKYDWSRGEHRLQCHQLKKLRF